MPKNDLQNQDRHWSRHAAAYVDNFVDPYDPNVETPLWDELAAIPDPAAKTVADLGCGTGPLVPHLAQRFGRVFALDFAPAMLEQAAARLNPEDGHRVTFLKRAMHDLHDLAGQLDVAVAVNSLVMPDVRVIDRTLKAIRLSLKPGGRFLGIVPSIDTINFQIMLFLDRALDQGLDPAAAKRLAGLQAERRSYDFAFGEFRYNGLRQKFWQPHELEYRLTKAGFQTPTLAKVSYPWDDFGPGASPIPGCPRSWDWFFLAHS